MVRNYFIKFNPEAKINYRYLFMLHGIASYNTTSKRFDYVYYRSVKDLQNTLKEKYGDKAPSCSTLNRILNDKKYSDYFSKNQKCFIDLHNNFSKYVKKKDERFVIISSKEADFLINQKDKMLSTYYCYLKYNCGLSKVAGCRASFTAKQFLSAIGLSPNNNDNISKVSKYNTILVNEKMIQIQKYRDIFGHERNYYSILST